MLIVMNREYTTVVTIMLIANVMIIDIFCNTLIMIVMIIMGVIIDIFCNMLPPAPSNMLGYQRAARQTQMKEKQGSRFIPSPPPSERFMCTENMS